ncbi:hypothetical protein SAMN04487895_101726 [Paenibacillus sophorae]|uniref:Uncharacterized protein n=1 Tax=Paenibacillus sophorae TaxID=1333845 RepID=A0A1H8H270_9BACL|nr:hypothetical protein [Paenibacillus sophorae]QWU14415.1 hypothetical protein KP014_21135 [Paenibacillus sophorae]SEN50119.1 hypothetical protein SAMN04487895_101726 [Paenibacillus sophorae]
MGKQYVQMPNSIIRNPELSSLDFAILIKLKTLQYINGSNEFVISSKEHIKDQLHINDNRTIKKSFDNLNRNQYILEPVKIDSHSKGKIFLNEQLVKSKNKFTHVYVDILKHIPRIGFNGVRLLFYYESYINRKITLNQFCYTGIATISRETGLNSKTIIKYNGILKKEKLLSIEKHELGTDYRYDENDKIIFSKYNNHYSVRLENIL